MSDELRKEKLELEAVLAFTSTASADEQAAASKRLNEVEAELDSPAVAEDAPELFEHEVEAINFRVTLFREFPDCDEVDGISIVVAAKNKTEAREISKSRFDDAGHTGPGSHAGNFRLVIRETNEAPTE